jgi:glycosyltransferase involved in cell wall biosynthesis
MRHVLFVDISQSQGAASLDLAATIGELVRRGHAVTLVALKPALFRDHVSADHVQYVDVDDRGWKDMWVVPDDLLARQPVRMLERLGRAWQFADYRRRLAEFFADSFRDLRPDLIHINGFNVRLAPVFAAADRLGLPVVVHARMPPERGRAERALARSAARVLTVSDAIGKNFRERTGVRADRVANWHNGVPFPAPGDPDRRASARAAHGIAPDARVVVVLGRIGRARGQDVFVDAMALLARERGDVYAFVVGRMGYREQEFAGDLARRAEREAPGRVRVVPDRRAEEAFLAAADVVVRPNVSLDATEGVVEGFARDLLHALGTGVPVVTTAVGGADRMFPESAALRAALRVVPPGDADGLRRVVGELLDHLPEARSAAARVAAEIRAVHGVSPRTDELLTIYKEVLAG